MRVTPCTALGMCIVHGLQPVHLGHVQTLCLKRATLCAAYQNILEQHPASVGVLFMLHMGTTYLDTSGL